MTTKPRSLPILLLLCALLAACDAEPTAGDLPTSTPLAGLTVTATPAAARGEAFVEKP